MASKYGNPRGKAATDAKRKYNSKNYDRIYPYVKKGKKSVYQRAAKASGFDSINDMIESLKAALCVQRLNACLPNVAWCEVTGMLFKNNAKIGAKYFPDELGVLKAGAAADIIVMDYKPFTPFSDENIDGHILFGMTGKLCRTTIANGKLLMKDRELIGIDEEAENAHILEAAKKLWGALNHREY